MRALLYPINGSKPSIVWLPVLPGHTYEDVKTRWVVDLDIRRWYPLGYCRELVTQVPNLNRRHPLRNHYSIIVSDDPAHSVQNECLRSMAGLEQHGNVLVIRHAIRRTAEITHMPPNERTLADLVVTR